MKLYESLSLDFDYEKYKKFLERIKKCNNKRAFEFISGVNVHSTGVLCNVCNILLPLYYYAQNKEHINGIQFSSCIKCRTIKTCPWRRMINDMKHHSKQRGHTPPELNIDDLKLLYSNQSGRCYISGSKLLIKRGDGDPFNFSPERICNKTGYVHGNVILICQWLQISDGDFSPKEILELLLYDKTHDSFKFDHTKFMIQKIIPRNPKNTYPKRDRNGIIVSKVCTDCNLRHNIKCFSARLSYCKCCSNIRLFNRKNTVHGFIKKMVNDAKQNSKKRLGLAKVVADNLFELLIKCFVAQNGRCCLTGIPFVFKIYHPHRPFIDRIDNSKGYIEGNITIIVAPLNTPRKPDNETILKIIHELKVYNELIIK